MMTSVVEEFSAVSMTRQHLLVELKIAKMVVILMENLFPFIDDLPIAKRDLIREYSARNSSLNSNLKEGTSLAKALDTGNISFFRTVSGSESTMSVQEKQEEHNLLLRADLLKVCSEFLRLLCLNNNKNQLYLANFLPSLTKNLVLHPRVVSFLKELVRNNDELLMEYSKIKKVSAVFDQKSPRNSPKHLQDDQTEGKEDPGNFGFEFFQEVVNRLKLFYLYTQADILAFMSQLGNTESKTFYMNQNNIFEIIHRPEIFIGHLLQLSPDMQSMALFLTYKTSAKDQVKVKLDLLLGDSYKLAEKKFLKEEIAMFASLCHNRNSITSSFFRNKFPMDLLVHYIADPALTDDFKALFFRLLRVLYIDKEPRQFLSFPTRARKYYDEAKTVVQDKPYFVDRSKQNKKELWKQQTSLDIKNKYSDIAPDDTLLFAKRETRIIAGSELRKELLLIGQLRTQIIENIEQKATPMLKADFKSSDFYNEFTLELLKTLNMMLKFGCYDVKGNN